jgi:hypothetical protein
MKPLLLAAVILLLPQAALRAQRISNQDGASLMSKCTSRDRAVMQGCEAYVSGVSDAVPRLARSNQDAVACVPDATTGTQMREALVAWAAKNPDARKRPAIDVVLQMLRDTYPCKRG